MVQGYGTTRGDGVAHTEKDNIHSAAGGDGQAETHRALTQTEQQTRAGRRTRGSASSRRSVCAPHGREKEERIPTATAAIALRWYSSTAAPRQKRDGERGHQKTAGIETRVAQAAHITPGPMTDRRQLNRAPQYGDRFSTSTTRWMSIAAEWGAQSWKSPLAPSGGHEMLPSASLATSPARLRPANKGWRAASGPRRLMDASSSVIPAARPGRPSRETAMVTAASKERRSRPSSPFFATAR